MSNNEKLESMIVKIDDRLDNVEKTMIRNTISLEEHVRRTNMLESYVKQRDKDYKEDIDPLKAHVTKMTVGAKAIFWFCSVIASVAGFIYLLQQLS